MPEQLKIEKEKKILILGDSNTECAINDSIFSQSINKSASSESFYFSYIKIREILGANSNIDTVLLAFAPHNIFENEWLANDIHIHSIFQLYYTFMNWEDFMYIFSKNPKAVIAAFPTIIERFIKNVFKITFNKSIVYGGHTKLNKIYDKSLIPRYQNNIDEFTYIKNNNFNVSNIEELYLKKIIFFCKEKGIKLYLINTPKRLELLNFSKYGAKEFLEYYSKEYFEIDFLDFSELQFPENNFGDYIHLNKEGAINFSKFLRKEGIGNLSLKYNRKNKLLKDFLESPE